MPATVEISSRIILLGYLEESLSLTVLGGVGRARETAVSGLEAGYREGELTDASARAAPTLEPPPQY